MKKLIIWLCVVSLCACMLSCHKKPKISSIRIAYSDFAFDKSVIYIISNIISAQTELKVELIQVPESDLVKSLVDNRADLCFSLWAPNTHADLISAYKDSIDLISPYLEDIRPGLAVPEYSGIKSIEDINTLTLPEKMIICPDSTNVLNQISQQVITGYNLTGYNLKTMNREVDILNLAKEKYEKSENFIIATYRPHWLFADLKMVLLNDSQKAFGTPEKAVIYSRKGFEKDLPKIVAFLKQIKLTMDDVEALMKSNESENSDPKVNAQTWVDANIDRINLWINKANENK